MSKVDTSKEAVERFAEWAERGLDQDAADLLRALLAERDQALARERTLLDSSQEARTYLVERNSAREEAKRLWVERDQLRREVEEARDKALEEAKAEILKRSAGNEEGYVEWFDDRPYVCEESAYRRIEALKARP